MEHLLTFETSHLAMKAERCLNRTDINAEIIPTPREISSECGFSLLIKDTSTEALYEFCLIHEFKNYKIYLKEGYNYEEYRR